MKDNPHDIDADLWLNLQSRLHQGQKDAQRLPIRWKYPIDPAMDQEASARQWMHDEIRHREPVMQILEQWLQTGIVDDSSDTLRWFLQRAFRLPLILSRNSYTRQETTEPIPSGTPSFLFPKARKTMS
jgi:hypothetical protein